VINTEVIHANNFNSPLLTSSLVISQNQLDQYEHNCQQDQCNHHDQTDQVDVIMNVDAKLFIFQEKRE
jgi:hypothetical protein